MGAGSSRSPKRRSVRLDWVGLTSTTSPEIGGYLDTHPRVRLLTYQSTLTNRMLIDAGFGAYQSPFGPEKARATPRARSRESRSSALPGARRMAAFQT